MKYSTLVKFIVFLMLFVIPVNTEAKTYEVSWQPYSNSEVDNLILYRNMESLVCGTENWTVPTSQNSITIDQSILGDEFYFYSLYAIMRTDGSLSPPSNEVLIKQCGDTNCVAQFSVTEHGGSLEVNFDTIPTVSGYQLRYTETTTGTSEVLDITGPLYLSDLPYGVYQFTLHAKDALGRIIEPNYVYQQVTVNFNAPPTKPNPPVIKVDSQGLGEWHTLMIGFQKNDPTVTHYKVNLYSSSSLMNASVASGAPGDLLADDTVSYGAPFCIDVSRLDYPIMFMRMTAVNGSGMESDSVTSYRLFGDLTGLASQGVASQSAVIDLNDKNLLYEEYKKYVKVPYAPSVINYCASTDLYAQLPLSNAARSDYNQDRLVNTVDYYYLLKELMGASGAGR